MFKVTIYNATNKTFHEIESNNGTHYWEEGNGSCDCNRSLLCGEESHSSVGVCLGCERFIIVDAEGDLDNYEKEQVLEEMNSEYPEDLVIEAMEKFNEYKKTLGDTTASTS